MDARAGESLSLEFGSRSLPRVAWQSDPENAVQTCTDAKP